ncbi:MAG TPA: DUF2786 domain-containing protein [Methylophilaceae bacterium]|nr:DUF2786 domain-containing protein [Methylophilaceae bacterium]
MTKSEAIEKIKKCLKLSASSNEHEAANALRQAKAIMEKFEIDDADMLASDAGESYAKAGATRKPSTWESRLSSRISRAFGCKKIFIQGDGKWLFIGIDPYHEIASYTFSVLYRQCKRARANHIKTKLKRCSPATTVRRADLFCEGWIYSVAGLIQDMVPGEKKTLAIEAYIAKNYTQLSKIEPRDRNAGRNLQNHDMRDFSQGLDSGKSAELNRGMGTEKQGLIT